MIQVVIVSKDEFRVNSIQQALEILDPDSVFDLLEFCKDQNLYYYGNSETIFVTDSYDAVSDWFCGV